MWTIAFVVICFATAIGVVAAIRRTKSGQAADDVPVYEAHLDDANRWEHGNILHSDKY